MKMKHLVCAIALSVGAVGHVFAGNSAMLRIGIDAAYPPFESKTAAGQLQGFDIDTGNAVSVKMQVKCVWVENVFDGLLPALQARKFDLVNSAMNITGKREQIVDFTPAIYVVPMVLIARKNSGLLPTHYALRGKRIGILQGAVQDDVVQRNWKSYGVEIVEYSDQNQVYADLAAGRLDGSVQEYDSTGRFPR